MIIITCLLSQEKKKKLMQRYENVVLFFAIGIIAWSPPPPPCIAALLARYISLWCCSPGQCETKHNASLCVYSAGTMSWTRISNAPKHTQPRSIHAQRKEICRSASICSSGAYRNRRIHRDLHRKIIECTKVLFTRAQSEQTNKNTVLQWRKNMFKTYNLRTFLWKC